jgi:hypothetical protein
MTLDVEGCRAVIALCYTDVLLCHYRQPLTVDDQELMQEEVEFRALIKEELLKRGLKEYEIN